MQHRQINMANRWWTDSVGLGGVDTSSSPIKKPDLGFSINDTVSAPPTVNHGAEEKENSEDPKEGAIEVSTPRRPRGRPPGSKNKPIPPIFVTRDSPNVLRSHVMEIANGTDIADSLSQFARKRQRGICVLSATGTVANVTLRHPTAPGAVMPLHGRFEIISLTGSFLPGPSPPGSSGLTVYMAGGQGQVVGGGVVGPLVASGAVMIMVATFSNAVYERLPIEDDEDDEGHGGVVRGEGSSSNLMYNSNNLDLGGAPNLQQLNHEAYSPWSLGHARPPF
ncbi:AT-hook motif nuclear-localized protein 20-like [Abrus precatorius]|uniref:AT-hook motif nuclear-localized protein 20-like n=1 Tax=Abrus precatorius TaxID=3816 RepID=A0A8B8LCG9_ABRPR|nr:AT-hook motif nuclear-localized protein 20-like [Abrus precatorius]